MINRRLFLTATAATIALPMSGFAQTKAPEVMEMTMGNPDAKVTVTEYASFTCPHCARFHETTFPQLKENYIDTGKINFIYREIYFDRFGLWAGMMARCAGPDRYFGVADLLYKRQRDWASGSAAENLANMRTIGRVAGLSDEQMDACFQDQAKAEAMVARFQETAGADDVTSTPTLIINGTKYGNLPYGQLAGIIDDLL